ncbi:MAG: hypothetical protein MK110_18950 [Fuerstiella sp.]|nr:hypothetical protein [Fuerstiella sp.]
MRQESDKEDLIRDATALVERAEIVCDGWSAVITIGFFRNGRCSVYFDQDPFYQFDEHGLLRRAFEAGFLYRSQASTLARLDRCRPTDKHIDTSGVVLQRSDLTRSDLRQFHERMTCLIKRLLGAITEQQYRVHRAVTPDNQIPARTLLLLNLVLQHKTEFIAPPAGPR